MGETLKWSYILINWVIVDKGWWQHVISIEAPSYLMDCDNVSPWVIQKDM